VTSTVQTRRNVIAIIAASEIGSGGEVEHESMKLSRVGPIRDPRVAPTNELVYQGALIQDLLQPLTALVARAEVVGDLARGGSVPDLLHQLAALRTCAARVARRADAVRRELDVERGSGGAEQGATRPADHE
jgi:hypothetical protein